MTSPVLRIGSRRSQLALKQAEIVRTALIAAHPDLAEPGIIDIVPIRTTGDRIQDRTLAEAGGKGLFTKEIEEALLAGTIDLAVHSAKDLPTWLPEGLAIGCYLPREDPRDAFFSTRAGGIAELAAGAIVGTASPRRHAQLLYARRDLRVVPLRGNVETRLKKLASGAVDATLLAVAGLKRLGLTDRITSILAPEEMLPAVAQGAIAVEIRQRDERAHRYLLALDHAATAIAVTAERALLAALD